MPRPGVALKLIVEGERERERERAREKERVRVCSLKCPWHKDNQDLLGADVLSKTTTTWMASFLKKFVQRGCQKSSSYSFRDGCEVHLCIYRLLQSLLYIRSWYKPGSVDPENWTRFWIFEICEWSIAFSARKRSVYTRATSSSAIRLHLSNVHTDVQCATPLSAILPVVFIAFFLYTWQNLKSLEA